MFNFLNINNNFSLNFSQLNPREWFRKKYTKDNVNILFIDDTEMPVVEGLKKANYKVKKLRDISSTEEAELKKANIVFVDFDGVGRNISPQHQGAGLVKEIKQEYGKSKYVVLYTAQLSLPSDTTMNSLFNLADDRMRKDSDVTDFIEQIRKGIAAL